MPVKIPNTWANKILYFFKSFITIFNYADNLEKTQHLPTLHSDAINC